MKKKRIIPYIILVCCILSIKNYAQVDTTKHLSFFPLQVGNYWQYEITTFPNDTTFYAYTTITKDTLMDNGKRYFAMESDFGLEMICRIDTSELSVYLYDTFFPDSEFMVFKLNPTEDYQTEAFKVLIRSGYEQVGLLSITRFHYQYLFDKIPVALFKFSQAIGISYYTFHELSGYEAKLVYAKINGLEYGQIVGVEDEKNFENYNLDISNYPNPFNSQTTLVYQIPKAGLMKITIFNLLGESVAEFNKQHSAQGRYSLEWNAGNLSSGVYSIVFEFEGRSIFKKCLLLK